MKIMCGKKKIGHDTTVYVDADARMIHLNLTEYEAPYKIVFDPKESGPDFEEFVKCLSRLNLPEHKMKALIKRGVSKSLAPFDLNFLIASIFCEFVKFANCFITCVTIFWSNFANSIATSCRVCQRKALSVGRYVVLVESCEHFV